MSKWFDTNYHYLLPEFSAETAFRWPASACSMKWKRRRRWATGQGCAARAAHLPVAGQSQAPAIRAPGPAGTLLPVYGPAGRLKQQGVSWVQIDEPILGLDLPPAWRSAFETPTGS
jgi:5-methyltetrahydropteroyltriglutamate--homocysteine methyltransferase